MNSPSFLEHDLTIPENAAYAHNPKRLSFYSNRHSQRITASELRPFSWQNREIRALESRQEVQPPSKHQTRFSWLSTLPSWRLSRCDLDRASLTIFAPLEDDMEPLNFELPKSARTISNTSTPSSGGSTSPDARPLQYNADLRTRNVCISAIILGICTAVASIAVAASILAVKYWRLPNFLLNTVISMGNMEYPFLEIHIPGYWNFYIGGHRVYNTPKAVMILLSLLLNTCLTAIFDAMGVIQSTTLRWTLFHEGRLIYNSNSRMFTSTRRFGPCHWTMNVLAAAVTVLGYASISALMTDVYIVGMSNSAGDNVTNAPVVGSRYALDFNASGLVGLGISLILQASLSLWCLVAGRGIIKTWSSNPLNTTKACISEGLESRLNGLEMLETRLAGQIRPDSANSEPRSFGENGNTCCSASSYSNGCSVTAPSQRQRSMSACLPQARRFANLLWIIVITISIWVLVVGIVAYRAGTASGEYVAATSFRSDFLAYWQSYAQVSFQFSSNDFYTDRRDGLALIIQCLVYAIISVGLHCAEPLMEFRLDETLWRQATTTGADTDISYLSQTATNWMGWVFFGFKSIIPWIFGFAFTCDLFVFMNLLPLCALMMVFLVLALFCEYLLRWRPRGPQPVTFGNIRTLAKLVDEWQHERLFWGDKGKLISCVRRAGTAGQRLADLDMKMFYSGLKP